MFEFLCRPGKQSFKISGHSGNAKADSHQPRYWLQGPQQIHSILEETDSEMILIALEHVERFTESQIAHNVERVKIEQL